MNNKMKNKGTVIEYINPERVNTSEHLRMQLGESGKKNQIHISIFIPTGTEHT